MSTYKLELAGLVRNLPIIKISDDLSIASFVTLGDQELVSHAAVELEKLIPEVDIFVTAEAKGISLAHELARLRGMKKYVVCRKSVKSYMTDPIGISVKSITTDKIQRLYLNGEDVDLIKDKKACLVDDVISTGESIKALEDLVNKVGGKVVGKAAILAEGDASKREDLIFLKELPLNPRK